MARWSAAAKNGSRCRATSLASSSSPLKRPSRAGVTRGSRGPLSRVRRIQAEKRELSPVRDV